MIDALRWYRAIIYTSCYLPVLNVHFVDFSP
jgi:hypothetical protein